MVDQINHHLYRKRGFYYFSRRVPKVLLGDYPKPRIVLALKTRHYRVCISCGDRSVWGVGELCVMLLGYAIDGDYQFRKL